MQNVHALLLSALRNHKNSNDSEFVETLALDDSVLYRYLFLNYRPSCGKPKGLRLTYQGYDLFKAFFKEWKIPIDEEYDFNSRWLIILERECTLPYSLDMKDRMLVVFEEEVGVMLKLNGGNIDMIANMWKESK